ncbi:MAG: hypothetical protein DRP76_01850 [Candidatus Omnitrophota bacterium]|nr:MAG: hypothetical protein DRP76_01850 [Candidatus Omnitrophota bacterium]
MRRYAKFIKWFYPGLRIKRWVILLSLGIILIFISSFYISYSSFILWKTFYVVLFSLGVFFFITGTTLLIHSFFKAIVPYQNKELIDIIYEKRYLSRGPKVVAIGGGTGLSTILEGLKEFTSNITAIVTVADEGGSSGRLREEFGILPPGDIRNCLVALAEAPQLMRDLFQYRFREGDGIKGHSFGNLLITALADVTGSFQGAVEESSKVLAIRGKVLPASLEKVRLKAEYIDGSTKEGEDKIPKEEKPIKRIFLIPPHVKAFPQTIEAIKEADIIILGPGSLFTSILPNLLIEDIKKSICQRKDILKIYICNVMTQHGETDNFTAFDHIETIISHTGEGIMNVCLVNCGRLSQELLIKYAQEKSFPVVSDIRRIKEKGILVIEKDIISHHDYLRHDPYKTARCIIELYNGYRRGWKEWKKR